MEDGSDSLIFYSVAGNRCMLAQIVVLALCVFRLLLVLGFGVLGLR